MNIIGVIPARMGSSRFPGKPLALINGIPMLGHVYHRSTMSQTLNAVYIATCDEEIRAYAHEIGAPCMMTSEAHQRASDRTAEAVATIERETGQPVDIVVMIQGDEPMLRPEMIDHAVAPFLEDPSLQLVNLMAPLNSRAEQEDPNEIKVVVDQAGYALYFSRAAIPLHTRRDVPPALMRKQVCIIPFRRAFLKRFAELAPTPLEQAESIDMLRAMEHGYRVKMVLTRQATQSVDTRRNLEAVAEKMRLDTLVPRYAGQARSARG